MRKIIPVISAIILSLSTFGDIPPDFCISNDEYQLYRLVNKYRTENGLGVIPVSKSLSYVAKLHVQDLYHNNPDTGFCSLNSWSNQGDWSACCHSRLDPKPDCILQKPVELTEYSGEGHELCYWANEKALPDTVFNFWISIEEADNLLLNREKWALYGWNAMGVGIYEGYASIWVGEALDAESEPTICTGSDPELNINKRESNEQARIISEPVDRFFLIFGSYIELEDAKSEMEKFRKNGFYSAKVLIKGGNYRVSLSDHSSMEEARNAKKRLPKDYQEAWILKF